ncbi:hypothetical protein V7161_12075, partial [Neobacillus drentensis]|uniref:hypothetical protein n=1 Tax=Neobacillus drentensis TaxID=220684 RepID=UPI00300024CA
RGEVLKPPRRFGACGVSSDLYIPQESSALRSNQQVGRLIKGIATHFFYLTKRVSTFLYFCSLG